MNAGCGSESMEQLDDGGAAYASEIMKYHSMILIKLKYQIL